MKAIILAGVKGERLRPFTNNCPKGMLKIEGKPILEYQLEWLKKYGVNEVVFACCHLSHAIQDYFGDGKKFSMKINYSIEDEPLGRGGAVKQAWNMIDSKEAIIVVNGDIYTETDLSKVIASHNEKRGIIATITIFPYKSPYGIVRIEEEKNGLIESFEEKRTLPYWVNGGIYVFEHEVKQYLPDKGDHENTTFPLLAEKKLLYGYKCLDYWKGIDTIKDLNEFAADKRNNISLLRTVAQTINSI